MRITALIVAAAAALTVSACQKAEEKAEGASPEAAEAAGVADPAAANTSMTRLRLTPRPLRMLPPRPNSRPRPLAVPLRAPRLPPRPLRPRLRLLRPQPTRPGTGS